MNKDNEEKAISEPEIESKISDGYVADTELENSLKNDLLNIDAENKEKEEKSMSAIDDKEFSKTNTNETISSIKKTFSDISGRNFIFPCFFMLMAMLYLEVVFHFLIYRSIGPKIIYPILFAIPFALFISFLTGLFNRFVNKLLLLILTTLICIVFNVQLIYHYIFKVYFSFSTIGMAGEAFGNFGAEILDAIKENIGGVILLFLPLIFLIFLIGRQLDFKRRKIVEQAILLGAIVVFHIIAVSSLLIYGKGSYKPYDLYHNTKVQDMCGKQLGIATMTRIDISKLIFKNTDTDLADTLTIPKSTPMPTKVVTQAPAVTQIPGVTQPPTPTPIDTSPNVMNIDFNSLSANETDKTFKKMDEYFAAQTPTNKNEYTGMFKGYNLIQITAEGFSPYAVNEQISPTLYKLVHNGFVFNNFYTPLWQTSTSDGEYANLLGIIPTGSRNMYNGRNNLWPFTLAHQFDLMGVQSRAYHDHSYTYYERDQTHPNLGFLYEGVGNGLILDHPNIWPQSDLEMINHTVDDYINDDRFNVYYLTVSGHMNYNFTGNMMAYKNRDVVKDLPYSDEVKAYIACQHELDKALEQLIKDLEDAGVADHTVIALCADHYPYGWDKAKYDEAAGHVLDPNFEIYRNDLILWSEGMKQNVTVDKVCGSLDILPTLSNLFGIEYDSRLMIGQDIFSDAPPLVVFANRSFITDKVMYNSETGEATNLTNEPLPDGYVDNMINVVKNQFTISKNILDLDYYRHLFSSYPNDFESE